jgi:hypothetical protein
LRKCSCYFRNIHVCLNLVGYEVGALRPCVLNRLCSANV